MFITSIAQHGYHQNQGDWEEKFQYQSPVSWKPFDELIKLELLTVTCLHKRDTLGRHDHSISTQQQLTTPCQHHYKYWKLRGDDQIRTRSDADWPMPLSGLAIMLTHCWHQSQRKKPRPEPTSGKVMVQNSKMSENQISLLESEKMQENTMTIQNPPEGTGTPLLI